MAKYYFALIVTGCLLWLLNINFSATREKLSYYNRMLCYGLVLAAAFPVLLSFFELPFTVATLFMVAVGMTWTMPKQAVDSASPQENKAPATKDIGQKPQAESTTKQLIAVEPTIVSSTYTKDYLDHFTYPGPALTGDMQDSLIIQGFNSFAQGDLTEAAKSFYQVWESTRDVELLSLVYAQLLQIYQELGQYKKLILIGKRTQQIIAGNTDSLSQLNQKISHDIQYYRRLYIIMAVNGIGHMRYSAVPDYIKQLALNSNH